MIGPSVLFGLGGFVVARSETLERQEGMVHQAMLWPIQALRIEGVRVRDLAC